MQKTSQRGNSIGINLLRFALFLSLTSSPFSVSAADLDLEKDLQNKLSQSKKIFRIVREKQKSGVASTVDGKRIKTLSEEIAASHMLLQERFRMRDEKVKNLGSKARERQEKVKSGYLKALQEYLSLVNSIPDSGEVSSRTADKLEKLLDSIVHEKKHPIIGSLPYKHLNYPAVLPSATPVIIPAYRNGNQIPNAEDTNGAPEAPISAEIVDLAQSLNWNPVSIYEYVKNNVETEWYWGCMKGAEETLRQKSGNDCDQAALFVALMRASGYPTRYVRGTIEFFPDIEKAKNLTGVSDPAKLGEFFQKAGIPYQIVMDGTTIKNIRIEHLWVETFVPYSNYRGAVMDNQGKTWLALDTSIKAGGYAENQAGDILSEMSFSNMRDDYLSAVQTGTPLEYLTARINEHILQTNPTKTYTDYLSTRTLNSDVMQILPSSLQFKETVNTGEYTALPAELVHKATLTAKDLVNNELFSITLDMQKLSNRKVIVSYEPETVDDQETINTFGGLDNTPAYLVHLRPVLMIDDERIVVGNGGIAMGADYNLSITITSPNGTETFTNSMISGNLTALGVVSQKVVMPTGLDETKATNLLYREAIKYIDNWNKVEAELSSLLKVASTRPLPTVVTLANTIDVTYAGEDPQGFEWKGLFLDADLRSVEVVTRTFTPDSRTLNFMQLSSLQGSVLESKLFEDAFGVSSISTAKLFGIASGSQPATPILTIDQTNIDAILPSLPFDDNIKQDITEAVANNSAIRIPQTEIAFEDWTGVGYIKENTTTGEAGYMLSGMVAGGMTAWGPIRWEDLLLQILVAPFLTTHINNDPSSAFSINKITGTDLQPNQTVNSNTSQPLQVLVRDSNNNPVSGASVIFTIKAGQGSLINETGARVATLGVLTNLFGTASARLELGMLTADNPGYLQKPGEKYPSIVGLNLVDAILNSGVNAGLAAIQQPFTIPAFPDKPSQIIKLNDTATCDILNLCGTISVYVKDHYGNPTANIPVDFVSKVPALVSQTSQCIVDENSKKAQLTQDDACIYNRLGWGECANARYELQGIKTSSDGSINVGVMVGDLPLTRYMVDATYAYDGSGQSTTFSLYTPYVGQCDPSNPPSPAVTVTYFNEYDSLGNNMDARPALTPSPLRARAYVLSDSDHDGILTVSYPDELQVYFNNLQASKVTENSVAVPGLYEYKYRLPVGLNNIPVRATAGEVAYESTTTANVYGVWIKMPRDIVNIKIDQQGYSVQDTTIAYDILPATYTAATALFLVYKNNALVDIIQTEKTGSPTAIISRGHFFDKNGLYEIQAVLNYGYKSEIWSQKSGLVVSENFIEILTPLNNTVFEISGANQPVIQAVNAGARLAGLNPDPTATTPFEWTTQIRFQGLDCPPYGPNRIINWDLGPVSVTGGQYLPAFEQIVSGTVEKLVRGGNLTLIPKAVINGQLNLAVTEGLVIKGKNPLRSDVQALLGTDTLRKIACHESGQRQFEAAPDGGVTSCPLFSHDRLGGVGIMQITYPAPEEEEVWDWTKNVAKGKQIFNEKISIATAYPGAVRNESDYITLKTNFNLWRQSNNLPPVEIVLLDFNAEQINRDAIRGYNGFAGIDRFGFELHEYRVGIDIINDQEILKVVVDEQTGRGEVVWEIVPAEERPNSGDRNYVNNVLAQNPICP